MKSDFYDMAPQERKEYTSIISKNEINNLELRRSDQTYYKFMPSPQREKERIDLERVLQVYKNNLMTAEQIYETQKREENFEFEKLRLYLEELKTLEEEARKSKISVMDRVA